jgi:hypothetical protein
MTSATDWETDPERTHFLMSKMAQRGVIGVMQELQQLRGKVVALSETNRQLARALVGLEASDFAFIASCSHEYGLLGLLGRRRRSRN